eukprot:TRINITY_DN6691_c0_g1_i2.p1 TRINITY_DN6691_c0_g1~~TRINITY_DN6691_c0_g1_i2.p1  ORF type:complete len:335 (-),score=50.18 TRINITY_DN6691_c0_g1_i2:588-1592(-)
MQRITNSILTSRFLSNMKRNLNNISTVQNQLASGKEILRTSQNPFIATRNKQLNNQISENKQYNANIKDTSNWCDTTDTALAQAGNVMARMKELMIKAGNGAYSEDEIATIKNEVVEKSKELAQIMNTTFDGAYVFGGTKGTTKPVTVDSDGNLAYADMDGNGIASSNANFTGTLSTAANLADIEKQLQTHLKTEISEGVIVEYNKTATDIFEFNDKKLGNINVMEEFSVLIKNLDTLSDKNATSAAQSTALSYVNGDGLSKMDSIIQNLLSNRAQVGTMQNRMESAEETNEDQNFNMTDILSSSEDIDFTQKTMEYSVMQTVYTASLQTSSKS